MQVPRALHAFNILLDNARLDVEAHHYGRRFAIDLTACNEDEAVLERCGHKVASSMSCWRKKHLSWRLCNSISIFADGIRNHADWKITSFNIVQIFANEQSWLGTYI